MNPHRKAQRDLQQQIAEELEELETPTIVTADVWASVLRMPVERQQLEKFEELEEEAE